MNPAKREFPLFSIIGLPISLTPSAIVASLILWVVLGIIALLLTDLSIFAAILAGLIMTLLHWIFEIIHQLGHARAARKTGHPMIGVRLYWVLGLSLYPADEGDLPARIHIRRALGGPTISLVVLAVAAVLLLVIWSASGDFLRMLALVAVLENLLVFTIGAVVPFPLPHLLENDGITLMRWWGK